MNDYAEHHSYDHDLDDLFDRSTPKPSAAERADTLRAAWLRGGVYSPSQASVVLAEIARLDAEAGRPESYGWDHADRDGYGPRS